MAFDIHLQISHERQNGGGWKEEGITRTAAAASGDSECPGSASKRLTKQISDSRSGQTCSSHVHSHY